VPRDKGFRHWLGIRLLGTKYATVRLSDDDVDRIAKQLGVDVDLLLEVRAQARVDLHDRGLSPPLSNSNKTVRELSSKRLYQYQLWMPTVVFAAWQAECELRGVHGPTFLRSLIHEYLLGAREPHPEHYWTWQGKLIRSYRGDGCQDERAAIPQGAKRALTVRAVGRGTRATPVVRALVLEALKGEHMGVPLVTSGMMYDDEARYNTGVPALLDRREAPR
jgi:hypothetical protein